MSEKILVTGASGFIAGHCILDLLAHGYQVRGTVRHLERIPQLRKVFAQYSDKADEIEFVQADLLVSDGWNKAVEGCDGLFHLASPVPIAQPKDPNEVILPAKEGTLNALRAAKEQGIKRVVLTSSLAAVMFGHQEKVREFTGYDWTNLEATNLPAYFQSKTIAERAAWEFVKKDGPELVTVNPGVVFGPALENDYGSSLQLLFGIFTGEYPLLPKTGAEIVDVRDVASLHRLAYESPDSAGRRFLCANGFTWNRDIAKILKKEFPDRKISSRELPNFLFALVSRFVKDMEMIRGEADKIKTADVSLAKSIGWKPRSVEESIISGAHSLVNLGLA